MRFIIDPTIPQRVKVRYNGKDVYDQTLQPGHHDVDVAHPKTCGVAELIFVEEDGTETPAGSANYGDCDCTPACQA